MSNIERQASGNKYTSPCVIACVMEPSHRAGTRSVQGCDEKSMCDLQLRTAPSHRAGTRSVQGCDEKTDLDRHDSAYPSGPH